jgi:tetratricopeptide (TPR) repeat protein
VRALVALNENQAPKAIELLQLSAPYELGSPPSSFYSGFYGALYAVYVRGCAYLALHRGAEAVAEFRKIIDHPGITGSDAVAALAQLQIARAYTESGDLLTARGCYTRFLRLWNTADRDVPIFKMAQSEMGRLENR